MILDKDGTADEVASDLPVTLSRRSAAYLQNCAWSAALSSITGSLIRTLTKYKLNIINQNNIINNKLNINLTKGKTEQMIVQVKD